MFGSVEKLRAHSLHWRARPRRRSPERICGRLGLAETRFICCASARRCTAVMRVSGRSRINACCRSPPTAIFLLSCLLFLWRCIPPHHERAIHRVVLSHAVFPDTPFFSGAEPVRESKSSVATHGHYERPVCLDLRAHTWFSNQDPDAAAAWKGVSYSSYIGTHLGRGWNGPLLYNTGPSFRPSSEYRPQTSPVSFDIVAQPTLIVWVWVDHFGHQLVDMIFPAFMALHSFGLGRNQSLEDVNILLIGDVKTHYHWAHSTAGLIGKPITVQELKRQTDSEIVCIPNAIFGIKLHSIDPCCRGDIRPGDYQLFRDYVLSSAHLRGARRLPLVLYFKKSDAWTGERRRIVNVAPMLDVVAEFFNEASGWNIQQRVMEDLTLPEQIELVSTASMHIAIVSTESHFAIFLRDGGVSVSILHPRHVDVNAGICDSSRGRITCLTVSSVCASTAGCTSIWSNVMVNLTEFRQAMQQAAAVLIQ